MKQDQSRNLQLIFYSGGLKSGNDRIHKMIQKLSQPRPVSITYIPSTHENGEFFYRRFCARFKKYGFKKFRYFSVDSDFLRKEMNDAFKSDVIYLAGGNTFYFLKHLRDSGFLKRLSRFAKNGGIVAGLSAGALIMTPHIKLAGYPPHEGDLNEVRLKNLRGLSFVNFEILPHYQASAKTHSAMLRYSRKSKYPVFAVPDGSGLVIQEMNMTLFGPIFIYHSGKRLKIA